MTRVRGLSPSVSVHLVSVSVPASRASRAECQAALIQKSSIPWSMDRASRGRFRGSQGLRGQIDQQETSIIAIRR